MSQLRVYIRGADKLLKFTERTQNKYIAAINETMAELTENLRDEVPVKSGNLRKSIQMIPLGRDGKFLRGRITIGGDSGDEGGVQYAAAVEYGIDVNDNVEYHARNYPFMVFEDWPNGPDELRWPDGKFRFKTVRHWSPANDFVGRAIKRTKIDKKLIQRITRRTF